MDPFSSHTESRILKTNTIKILSVPLTIEEAIIIGSKGVQDLSHYIGDGWHSCAFTKVLLQLPLFTKAKMGWSRDCQPTARLFRNHLLLFFPHQNDCIVICSLVCLLYLDFFFFCFNCLIFKSFILLISYFLAIMILQWLWFPILPYIQFNFLYPALYRVAESDQRFNSIEE